MAMGAGLRKLWRLIWCAGSNWAADEAATIGAALAFYSAFSIAPLLIIILWLAGWIVGAEMAYSYVGSQLTALFGESSAKVILEAVRSSQTEQGTLATIISIATLIIGATTVLAALENALEHIWGARGMVPPGWRGFVRARLLSFGVILALGFLLIVSLSLTTALSALRAWVAMRHADFVSMLSGLDFLLSIGMSTGLVVLIYRYLPAKRLAWQPVVTGALITALLFHLGRWAIGLYLSRSTQPSAFGAAASFAALLLWLYYSAQIFLFGAELTACLGNSRARPSEAQSQG